jgi:predicted nuclease with TOPRIM domain
VRYFFAAYCVVFIENRCAGVDKKTSLLDYMVKSLYDKNEENLLEVIEDLTQLSDNTLPLSTTEALNEYESLQKQLTGLQKELERVQPSNSIFSSPTAKLMSDSYCTALEKHLNEARERIAFISKRKILLSKKIRALMEYFGEDPKSIDNNAIFQALKEFRRALAFSKETVEWKLSRSQHQA